MALEVGMNNHEFLVGIHDSFHYDKGIIAATFLCLDWALYYAALCQADSDDKWASYNNRKNPCVLTVIDTTNK